MVYWQEDLTQLLQIDVAIYTKRPKCNQKLVYNSTCSIIALDYMALIHHKRTKMYMRLISIKRETKKRNIPNLEVRIRH